MGRSSDTHSSGGEGRRFVLGMGCENGAPAADVLALAEDALRAAGIGAGQLASIASIDLKRREPAILALAEHFGIPIHFFDAARLEEETPRLKNPSARVFALIGCHGVAEASALAAAGASARLVVPKLKSSFSTAAIAKIR
jgi:cobalamin biosynthesis protein CbiG